MKGPHSVRRWRWLALAWCSTLWLGAGPLGCRTSAPPKPPSRAGEAVAPALPATLRELNRRARAQGVVERVQGITIADPYRALEQPSPLTEAWIEAQSSRTERALAAYERPAQRARIAQLMSIGTLSEAQRGGGLTFVLKREGARERPALFVMGDDAAATQAPRKPLIAPEAFGDDAAIDYYAAAPDGRHVAFGISHGGDERAELRVVRVADAALLPLRIEHAKWSAIAWLNDGTGFYYTRYPKPGEARYDAQHEDAYFPAVFFHRLGNAPERDARVYQSDVATDVVYCKPGDDDRFLLLTVYRGFTRSDVYLLDRGEAASERVVAPGPENAFSAVTVGVDALASAAVHRGRLVLATDWHAPHGRLLQADARVPFDPDSLKPLVGEGAGTIEDWTVTRERIVVHSIDNLRSRLSTFALDGTPLGDIELPGLGSVDSLAAQPHDDGLAYVFSSFFYPPALFVANASTRASHRLDGVEHDIVLDRYAVDEAWVRSADGTRVHAYFVHDKTFERDGNNAALVYGYGGFNVSVLPSFTRSALRFIERGGVYVVASLRGGGEFGESWHRAGMLENKPRVFEDFEAVVRWLTSSGISRPERIAITGGSNGGLLMGAMLTRAPETFAAAASYVGLYDMVRYTRFPPAAIWVSEYGDPAAPDALRYLLAYSPYHALTAPRHYPAALIETAEHDTRVFWGHSTKFAARLQEMQFGPAPIYFYMTRSQGHGRGMTTADLIDRYVRQEAFFDQVLGPP